MHQRELGVILALAALCLFGVFGTDGFSSSDNLLNVGQQASLIGIMAVGATFVIIAGEIDLSVGSIYVLASMVIGMLLQSGMNWSWRSSSPSAWVPLPGSSTGCSPSGSAYRASS